MHGIWKERFRRLVHDFKRFAKDEEVAKINKAVVEMANNFNLGIVSMTLRSSLRWFLRN